MEIGVIPLAHLGNKNNAAELLMLQPATSVGNGKDNLV